MRINGRLVIIIFLLGVNLTGLSAEEESQASADKNIFNKSTLIGSDAQSYVGISMASTDLAVSKAEIQQKHIPITIQHSSSIISIFVGEATISRYNGVTNYKIVTETRDYVQNDYIADAHITLMEPLSQIQIESFKATIMRISQEHGIVYNIITDHTPDFEQKNRIKIELGQRRSITLPKDEVNILAPPDPNRQAAPSPNSLVYFRQQENEQPQDSDYRSNAFLWTGVNLFESFRLRSTT